MPESRTPREVLLDLTSIEVSKPQLGGGTSPGAHSRPGNGAMEFTGNPAPCRYVDVWCVKMVTSFIVTIFDW